MSHVYPGQRKCHNQYDTLYRIRAAESTVPVSLCLRTRRYSNVRCSSPHSSLCDASVSRSNADRTEHSLLLPLTDRIPCANVVRPEHLPVRLQRSFARLSDTSRPIPADASPAEGAFVALQSLGVCVSRSRALSEDTDEVPSFCSCPARVAQKGLRRTLHRLGVGVRGYQRRL